MRHSITLTLRPLGLIDRLWYWSIRLPVPASTSGSPGRWMRLLPQSWTRLHRAYAQRHGLFWLRCDLCARHYGGHQAAGSIPDPTAATPWGRSIGICPACTRAGRSWRVPHPLEAVLAEIDGRRECDHDPLVQDCIQCVAYDAAVRSAVSTWQRGSETANPRDLREGP